MSKATEQNKFDFIIDSNTRVTAGNHITGRYDPKKYNRSQILKKVGYIPNFGGQDIRIGDGNFDLICHTD